MRFREGLRLPAIQPEHYDNGWRSMTKLVPHVPEGALPLIEALLSSHHYILTVSRSRKTKLGDFRAGRRGQPHRISVNNDLGSHHFLLTLVHEIAHMKAHERYGKRIKPHGIQWQNEFVEAMLPFLNAGLYPEPIEREVRRYLGKPRASCSADASLLRALRGNNPDVTVLEELEPDTLFRIGRRPAMRKGQKRRTRYLCEELNTGRTFAVHPLAEVEPLIQES